MAEEKKGLDIGQLDETAQERMIRLGKRMAGVQSVEELIAVFKEEGHEIPADKAEELYTKIAGHRAVGESGELTDEELEDVNGGFLISLVSYALSLGIDTSDPEQLRVGAKAEVEVEVR